MHIHRGWELVSQSLSIRNILNFNKNISFGKLKPTLCFHIVLNSIIPLHIE